MIVDNLKSCYTTRMRLRLDPELIATVRWYWAPPGALPLPTETAFGSTVWETSDRDYPQPDLGEVSLTRTWDKGATPLGITGKETPTPLDWFANGVPADVEGPFAPCEGTLPAGMELWLRPEEITSVDQTPTFQRWPAAPGTVWHGWAIGTLRPVLEFDPDLGRYGAMLERHSSLPVPHALSTFLEFHRATRARSPAPFGTLAVSGDFTVFVAFKNPGHPLYSGGFPGLGDLGAGLWASTQDGEGGVQVQLEPTPFDSGYSPLPFGFHTLSVRLDGATAVVRGDGMDQATGSQAAVPWNLLRIEEAVPFGPSFPRRAILVFEVLYWPRALGAAELGAVDAYFAAKYRPALQTTVTSALGGGGSPDSPVTYLPEVEQMPVGGIVPFAGSVVPNGYLACDGTDYDPATFPALFGVLGHTWDTFRGQAAPASGHFRVPKLNGLGLLGVGGAASNPTTSARALADQGGEEQHQLVTAEMPSHNHPITDPGHAHDPTTSAGGPIRSGVGAPAATHADSAGVDTQDCFIAPNTTGISVQGAGGDGPHNNLPPFAAVLFIIKT